MSVFKESQLNLKEKALSILGNDNARSEYVRILINDTSSKPDMLDPELQIPHVLIQFWDDSRNIPEDVQACMNSWLQLRNNGFNYSLFDDKSAREFISNYFTADYAQAFDRCKHPAMRSDYFRLCYMVANGGIYIDADDVYQGSDYNNWFSDNCLKLAPLCYSMSKDCMIDVKSPASKEMSNDASQDLIYYVNNNPLIAPPRHPVINMALERSKMMLLSDRASQDVQAITGPGNLTICLAMHAISARDKNEPLDFKFLFNWDTIALSKWPLSYRNDERNWRLWTKPDGSI